jgi:GDP-D-mannose dehydratase
MYTSDTLSFQKRLSFIENIRWKLKVSSIKKRSLITGIAGQDGSHLAEFLLEKDYEVYGIIRRNSVIQNQNWRLHNVWDKIKNNLYYADITDFASLLRVIKLVRPDEIYNLAAQSHVRISFDEPLYTVETIVQGTLNLLEIIRLEFPNIKMYQASSSEMFGNNIDSDGFQRETTQMNPVSPYGCFPAETKILFNDITIKKVGKNKVEGKLRNKSIENIKIGDEVLSYNTKTGIKEYKKVLSVMERNSNELYLIKFSNGNFIECTEEHPIYIHNSGWVKAKDVSVGDKAIQYKYSGLNSRCNIDKNYNEIYGNDTSETIKQKKSDKMKIARDYKDDENTVIKKYKENTKVVSVVSVEKKEKECKVYNFEVEDNNNYFAYGILVHNCAKLFGYNIVRNYRHSYNLFLSNGILFNHESPRRGINFVTNKIVKGAIDIKNGKSNVLKLGNLNACRDWGHAKDYVEAMWLMLQHDSPDDFVCATGISHSVKNVVEYVFDKLGMDYRKYVEKDPIYYRPEELNVLKGDPTKIQKELKWKHKYTFETMLDEMMEYWLNRSENGE